MNQIYYTQEGTPYILKAVTKNLNNFSTSSGPVDNIKPLLQMNTTQDLSVSPWVIRLTNQTKKIIPVSCSFSVGQSSGQQFVNINTSFYFVLDNAGTTGNFQGIRSIAKSLPLINRCFFTDENNFSNNFYYNMAVYKENDFTDPNGGIQIFFTSSESGSLSFTGGGSINIPQDTINTFFTCVTFTYFEML